MHARLPEPRGPLSAAVIHRLAGRSTRLPGTAEVDELVAGEDPLASEDLHLALHCLYELHYRGWGGSSDDLEWDPEVLRVRGALETGFEAGLRRAVPRRPVADADVRSTLLRTVESNGPSLSRHVQERGTLDDLREFAVHRSVYQLREADAHTWAIPRFGGSSRAALIEIQADEYGNGRPGRAHAELFATTMEQLGLDPTYGAYLDEVPASTLATTNLLSLLGLHRRLLPAVVGHLAAFEMTSVVPMSRYAAAFDRHGLAATAREFYDVHVVADHHHGPLALDELAGRFVGDHPGTAGLVVWGAATLMEVERRFAAHLLDSWSAGRSSLRPRRVAVAA